MKFLTGDEQFKAAEMLEQLRLELESVDGYPIPPPRIMEPDGSFRAGDERMLDMRRCLEIVARVEKLVGVKSLLEGFTAPRPNTDADCELCGQDGVRHD